MYTSFVDGKSDVKIAKVMTKWSHIRSWKALYISQTKYRPHYNSKKRLKEWILIADLMVLLGCMSRCVSVFFLAHGFLQTETIVKHVNCLTLRIWCVVSKIYAVWVSPSMCSSSLCVRWFNSSMLQIHNGNCVIVLRTCSWCQKTPVRAVLSKCPISV